MFENWDGVSGNELKKDDYKIDHWTYWTGTENKNVGESELKNAGSYTVYLYGMGNYDDSQKTAVFTINKCQLEALSNICTLICPLHLIRMNILKCRSITIAVAKLNCQILLLCNIRSPITERKDQAT